MLLIWDIHLDVKREDRIMEKLRWLPREENIVFLWDYLPGFVYNRHVMAEFYDFLLELSKKSNVYVMAGNHDWLGDKFVFDEAQKTILELGDDEPRSHWLTFITEPITYLIEWKHCLFIPFENMGIKGESASDYVNSHLADLENVDVVFFHHYIADFDYWDGLVFRKDDIAIDPNIISANPNVQFISWHVHRHCQKDNYFCTGSFWATNQSETEDKFVWNYFDGKFSKIPVDVNKYVVIDGDALEKNLPLGDKRTTLVIYATDVLSIPTEKLKWDFYDVVLKKKFWDSIALSQKIVRELHAEDCNWRSKIGLIISDKCAEKTELAMNVLRECKIL